MGVLVSDTGTVPVFSHTNRVIDSFHGSDNHIHRGAVRRGTSRLPSSFASLMVGKSRCVTLKARAAQGGG